MPRQPAKPVTSAEDPLADLREEPVTLEPSAPSAGSPEQEAVAIIRPMVSEATHAEMVAEAVAAFHRDPTTQGFLHGGGQCGCFYVARVALQAAVPVMTPEDMEERDLEPSHA